MKTKSTYFFTRVSQNVKNAKRLLLFLCMFNATISYAQDVITLKNGTEIEGKVFEIGTYDVKYSSSENYQLYHSVAKIDVFMIKYSDGKKELFNEESSTKSEQLTAQSKREPKSKFDPDTTDFAKMRQKRFNGPRVGFSMLGDGTNADYLASQNKRQNFVSFGWQFESVLFTAGNTAGLLEFVPLISGFEQGLFIPSANILLGIRGGDKMLFEFAMGPNFSAGRDYNGDPKGSIGLVIALGTNFRKDNINFPITLAFVPSVGSIQETHNDLTGETTTNQYETGWRLALLVGFNTRKR